MTKLWCAKIQLTTKQRTYRFSNDLQLALNQTTNPQQILQALIVVPLAPYTDHQQPPMGVGKIQKIYKTAWFKTRGLAITRGQLMGAAYWTERPYAQVAGYLTHNYVWLSQQQISQDITYWQHQFYRQTAYRSPLWQAMTNWRIRRQLRRLQRQQWQRDVPYWHL